MPCLHAGTYMYFIIPGPIRPLRRRRSQQPLQRLSSPIEILDSSRENIDENLPHQNNISNTSKKMVCL